MVEAPGHRQRRRGERPGRATGRDACATARTRPRRALQAETLRRQLVPMHAHRAAGAVEITSSSSSPSAASAACSPQPAPQAVELVARAGGRHRSRAPPRAAGASASTIPVQGRGQRRERGLDVDLVQRAPCGAAHRQAVHRRPGCAPPVPGRTPAPARWPTHPARPCIRRPRRARVPPAVAPSPSPKNCAASSGNWCASSTTNACAPGRISPKPSCLSARSASSRWWLTTTRSAVCARWRAWTTKHSPQNGHSLPRQLSAVDVTCGSSSESSGKASSSARSPNAGCAAPRHHALELRRQLARRKRGLQQVARFGLLHPVAAEVVRAPLQQRRFSRCPARRAHPRQVAK